MSFKLIYFWRRLWKARNTVVFENYQITIPCLPRQFSRHWQEAETLLLETELRSPSLPQQVQRFCPSSPSWTIWVDAAIRSMGAIPFGSLGLVVKDAANTMRTVVGFVHHHVTDPLTLEMMAIREAFLLLSAQQDSHPVVNSDCDEAVRLLHTTSFDIRLGSLLLDCRLLFSSLQDVYLCYVRHHDNSAAHLVERKALNYPDRVHTRLDLCYKLHM
ncbi:hypothetical protein LINGRAHAP2_LOCUS2491 [Linum grandiflorum]